MFLKEAQLLKIKRRKQVAKNLKLKLARVELDMTQGDLAEAVGVTRQTIGLIEAGNIILVSPFASPFADA